MKKTSLKLSRPRVTQILIDVKKGINSQINIPDPPQIGDVWLFTNCDDDYGISGFPGWQHVEWRLYPVGDFGLCTGAWLG